MTNKTIDDNPKPPAPTANVMDLTMLEQLGRLMSENDLTLVDLRDGKQRVYLRRGHEPVVTAQQPAAAPPPAPAAPAQHAETAPPPPTSDDTAGLVPIKSPMVGTFYAASDPDAKPFIAVGDKIGPDSDVCIIEAMKVFNNIKAETSGTVAKVLVTNGDAVEYGQPLFLVRP